MSKKDDGQDVKFEVSLLLFALSLIKIVRRKEKLKKLKKLKQEKQNAAYVPGKETIIFIFSLKFEKGKGRARRGEKVRRGKE